jgi:hypothetical protein
MDIQSFKSAQTTKTQVLCSVIYHKKQKYFLAIFFSVLQLVGIEITYEGIEYNLGVKKS